MLEIYQVSRLVYKDLATLVTMTYIHPKKLFGFSKIITFLFHHEFCFNSRKSRKYLEPIKQISLI